MSNKVSFLKIGMIEGETIASLFPIDGTLYIVTTLDRIFRTTNLKPPYFDVVEMDDEEIDVVFKEPYDDGYID